MSDEETPPPAASPEIERMRLENERLRLRYNLLRFMIGTVALGILTAVLNWQIQKARIELERVSKENEFIGKFVDRALADNPEKRRDFAEYFVRLTPTPESRKRWEEYREYAQGLVDQSVQQQRDIEEQGRKLREVAERSIERGYEPAAPLTAAERDEEEAAARRAAAELEELRGQLLESQRNLAALRSTPTSLVYTEAVSQEEVVAPSATVSAWSYVGTWRNERFVERVFEEEGFPQPGSELHPRTEVFRRAREPRFDAIRGWTMGDRVGVIEQNQVLYVEEVARIPAKGGGWRVWVLGRVRA